MLGWQRRSRRTHFGPWSQWGSCLRGTDAASRSGTRGQSCCSRWRISVGGRTDTYIWLIWQSSVWLHEFVMQIDVGRHTVYGENEKLIPLWAWKEDSLLSSPALTSWWCGRKGVHERLRPHLTCDWDLARTTGSTRRDMVQNFNINKPEQKHPAP